MEIIDLSLSLINQNVESAKKFLSLFPFSYNQINCLMYVEDLNSLNAAIFNDVLKTQEKVGEFNYCLFENTVEVKLSDLNKTWLNYFKKHEIKVNVNLTYKDDISILSEYDNIAKLIIRVRREEFDLVAINDLYKKYQIPLDLKVKGVGDSLLINDDELSQKMQKYFPIWLKDNEGILFVPYHSFVDSALGGSYKICVNDSCIGKNFYMDEKGDIFTCNKSCLHKYCYGNMSGINSLDDIYLAKEFERFVSKNIERRKECSSCSCFKKCQGGCPSDSLLNQGKIEKINENYCKNYKLWEEFVREELHKIVEKKLGLKELNPSFRSLLIDSLKMDIRL